MKCKNCDYCKIRNGTQNEYLCVGVPEPFTIDDLEQECTVYPEKNLKQWSWNENNGETWWHGTFDTKEEAIQDALEDIEWIKRCNKGESFIFVGECEYVPLDTYVDPDMIMEYLDETYCSKTGCEDYIYGGVSDEDRKWLENELSDLMHRFHKKISLQPHWFNIISMEKVNLKKFCQ